MTRLLMIVLLPALMACGIDGDPVPPSQVEDDAEARPAGSSVTITGSAEIGIAG